MSDVDDVALDIFNQPIYALNERQRFIFGHLGILFDSVELCYGKIRQSSCALLTMPPDSGSKKAIVLAVTNDAWRIIDSCYQIFQLLNLFYEAEAQDGAESVFVNLDADAAQSSVVLSNFKETISWLRNQMDHIGSNINNILNASRIAPIHGAISFIVVENQSFEQAFVHTFICGPVMKSSCVIANPADMAGKCYYPPVDFFHFSAFGRTLDLTALVSAGKNLQLTLKMSIEASIRARFKVLSDTMGTPMEDLLGYPPAYLHLILTFKPNFGEKQG